MESRAQAVAKNTLSEARRCMKHLLPAFGPRLICDITPDDIAAYQRRRLQSSAQGRTVNLEIGELRKVLKSNDAWLPFVGKYRKLKERTDVGIALSPEQERALLQATSAIDSACHTATMLCLNTAMRSDESDGCGGRKLISRSAPLESATPSRKPEPVAPFRRTSPRGRFFCGGRVAILVHCRSTTFSQGVNPNGSIPPARGGLEISLALCSQTGWVPLPLPRPSAYLHHQTG